MKDYNLKKHKTGIITITIFACLLIMVYMMENKDIDKLCNYIERKDYNSVEKTIKRIRNLNVSNKRFPMLQHILLHGDVTIRTPLYSACSNDNKDIIEILLKNGADPNYTAYALAYPLEHLCDQGPGETTDALELLLKYGADPNLYRYTPPMFRLAEKLENMSERFYLLACNEIFCLIDNGADLINAAPTYEGYTILHFAAQQKNTEFLSDLLKRTDVRKIINEKTKQSGYTALICAVRGNQTEGSKILLAVGAEKSIKDNFNKTALDYAKENSNQELIELLE